jgi:hypothetical protein
MQILRPTLDVVYRVQQQASSAVRRRRYRSEFADVQAPCLFVGYPPSGHSMVGACLNAHRDAVVSHELGAQQLVIEECSREVLYSRILARATWFNLRGNRTNCSYEIPNQWQGRFDSLHVVGDKLGGSVTRCIAEHPDFLERLRSLVEVPWSGARGRMCVCGPEALPALCRGLRQRHVRVADLYPAAR